MLARKFMAPRKLGKKWQTDWQTLLAILQIPGEKRAFHFRVKEVLYH